VYIFVPKANLRFSVSGTVLVEAEADAPEGLRETHRRLSYWLEEFRLANQSTLDRLFTFFRLAAVAVVVEILIWTQELVL